MKNYISLLLASVLYSVCSLYGWTQQQEQMNIHLKSGEVISYTVDLIDSVTFAQEEVTPPVTEPKVGDFYYADGTWSSGEEAPLTTKKCIGIIFYTGLCKEAADDCAYKLKNGEDALDEVHGYVIAIDNASTSAAWGSWDVDGNGGAGTSYDETDFRGYSNTKAIEMKAISKAGELKDDATNNYPAAYYATIVYEQENPAPESSTGWFLPSAYQLKYIYNHHDEFNEQFEKIEGGVPVYGRDAIYWSSTEHYAQNGCRYWANMVNLDSANITPGYISNQNKNKTYQIRSILVF